MILLSLTYFIRVSVSCYPFFSPYFLSCYPFFPPCFGESFDDLLHEVVLLSHLVLSSVSHVLWDMGWYPLHFDEESFVRVSVLLPFLLLTSLPSTVDLKPPMFIHRGPFCKSSGFFQLGFTDVTPLHTTTVLCSSSECWNLRELLTPVVIGDFSPTSFSDFCR